MENKDSILSEINRQKDRLSSFGVIKVGLFGSYARNEQSNQSDIDILIEFESQKETFDNYMAVYDTFEAMFKNEKLDIVTTNALSPYIGPHILKEVVYA